MKLSLKQMTLNAMFAAIYVDITIFLPSYGPLQLRLSEMFAHLPVFNKNTHRHLQISAFSSQGTSPPTTLELLSYPAISAVFFQRFA